MKLPRTALLSLACPLILKGSLLTLLISFSSVAMAATTIVDSTQATPSAKKAEGIVTMAMGVEPTTTSGSFSINATCPSEFSRAYVTVSPGQVRAVNWVTASSLQSGDLLLGFKACVTGITGSGPYTVNYSVYARTRAFTEDDQDDRYSGRSKTTYTLFDTSDMPDTLVVGSASNSTSNGSVSKLAWVLYCYPTTGTTEPPNYSCP